MHWIDPESLPESKHRIRQFLLNGEGEVDGFLSTKSDQVHVPPHLGKDLTKAFNVGDLVYVRGVKPRDADVLAAVCLETAQGERIEDHGPPRPPSRPPKAKRATEREMEGVTERVLFAPRGERVGVLLNNGVVVRFDPDAADELEEFLLPGTRIAVSGQLQTTKWGTVLDADYFWRPEDAENDH